jgi:hypothetical protein
MAVMRSSRIFAAWIFRLAVAVTAAATADPILERMSNAGVFGSGQLTDHSNLDVIPALCIAFALSALFVFLLVRRTLVRTTYPPNWLRHCAADIHAQSWRRMLPSIFAMQMICLFVMETLEQIVVAGHPLGGTVWLGAPVVASVLFHLLVCFVSAWALFRALHWSTRAIVRIVRFALEILRKLFEQSPPPRLGLRYRALPKFIEPYLRALQGRAPPSILPALTP